MAPLSVLPGRLRFENSDIVGKFQVAEYLEREIKNLDGVLEASVNYRTGRILIRFDENLSDRLSIAKNVKEVIDSMPNEQIEMAFCCHKKTVESDFLTQMLFKVAARALLPKPLNIILPMAMGSINKMMGGHYDRVDGKERKELW